MVAAVNAAARRAGVQIGVTLADARAICPGLRTRAVAREDEVKALRGIGLWLGRYGPNRNTDGIDGLWVEITGVAHLFGGERELVCDMGRRLQAAGYTARIGLASTYGAAHALARYGCGKNRPVQIASAGQEAEALAPLPVDGLRLEAASVQLLKRLGLKRIGDLSSIPRAALERRFRDVKAGARADREALSRAVVWRLDQAMGHRDEPRHAMEEPPNRAVHQPFGEPLISGDGIEVAVRTLAGRLADELMARGEGARALALHMYRADGTRARLEAGFSQPTHAPDHICTLFRDRLAEFDAGFGVDQVSLEALTVSAMPQHQSALASASRRTRNAGATHTGETNAGPADPDALARLTDRLANRVGASCVQVAVVSPSHLPERAAGWASIFDVAAGGCVVTASASHGAPGQAGADHRPRAPRPTLMLSPPEPIAVIADVPEGAPVLFTWRRLRHRVRRASGPERIAPEWWRTIAQRFALRAAAQPTSRAAAQTTPRAAAQSTAIDTRCSDEASDLGLPGAPQAVVRLPRTRDYYVLEDADGGRFWVFRDGTYRDVDDDGSPSWYIHGVFA